VLFYVTLPAFGNLSIITYHSRKEEADSVVSEIEAKDQRAVALQLDVGDIQRSSLAAGKEISSTGAGQAIETLSFQ
jgi:hypothetical protein